MREFRPARRSICRRTRRRRFAQATTLGEVAAQKLGSADKASLLLDLNQPQIQLPDRLPVGATLSLPQAECHRHWRPLPCWRPFSWRSAWDGCWQPPIRRRNKLAQLKESIHDEKI